MWIKYLSIVATVYIYLLAENFERFGLGHRNGKFGVWIKYLSIYSCYCIYIYICLQRILRDLDWGIGMGSLECG